MYCSELINKRRKKANGHIFGNTFFPLKYTNLNKKKQSSLYKYSPSLFFFYIYLSEQEKTIISFGSRAQIIFQEKQVTDYFHDNYMIITNCEIKLYHVNSFLYEIKTFSCTLKFYLTFQKKFTCLKCCINLDFVFAGSDTVFELT